MRHRRALSVTLAVACLGAAYALWSQKLDIASTVETAHVNADFVAASTNDPPGTLDSGYVKDVGWSESELVDTDGNGTYDVVEVTVNNAYPCYTTVVDTVIHNGGNLPERIAAVDIEAPTGVLDVAFTDVVGVELEPGQTTPASATVHVLQPALQSHTYTFRIRIDAAQWINGTIGFWRAWDNHNTFTHSQIEQWLGQINTASSWQGPTTCSGMVVTLRNATSGPSRQRFLGHYLATRLDVSSGIIGEGARHDVRVLDPGNYLGLSNPGSATTTQIFEAIEAKYTSAPTSNQFLIMKSICDALNNHDI